MCAKSLRWRRSSMKTAPLFCKPTTRHKPRLLSKSCLTSSSASKKNVFIVANQRATRARWRGTAILTWQMRKTASPGCQVCYEYHGVLRRPGWRQCKTNSRTLGSWGHTVKFSVLSKTESNRAIILIFNAVRRFGVIDVFPPKIEGACFNTAL